MTDSSWVEKTVKDAKAQQHAGADQSDLTKNLYKDVQSGIGMNGKNSPETQKDLAQLNEKLHAQGILPHVDIIGTNSGSQSVTVAENANTVPNSPADKTGNAEATGKQTFTNVDSTRATTENTTARASDKNSAAQNLTRPASFTGTAGSADATVQNQAPAQPGATTDAGAKVADIAKSDVGQSLWKGDLSDGSLGCASSVSNVLRQAGVDVHELNTKSLAGALQQKNWTASSTPHVGDVVIGERGAGQHGHTGIVGAGGVVYDNNSNTGQFTKDPLNSFNNKEFAAGVTYYSPPGEVSQAGSAAGSSQTADATAGAGSAAGAAGGADAKAAAPASPGAPAAPENNSANAANYTVQTGDNLSTIIARLNPNATADQHKAMLDQVIADNQAKYPGLATNANLILPDWQLKIPSQTGDSTNTIATAAFTTPDGTNLTNQANPATGALPFNGSASELQKSKELIDMFVKQGLSPAGAAGIVGNFMRESSLDPGANQSGGEGYGLAQWGGSRKAALLARSGSGDAQTQVQFVMDELKGTANDGEQAHPDLLKELSTTSDPVQAAQDFASQYERAGVMAMQDRTGAAKNFLSNYDQSQADTRSQLAT